MIRSGMSREEVLIVCGVIDFEARLGYTMQVIRTGQARAMLSSKARKRAWARRDFVRRCNAGCMQSLRRVVSSTVFSRAM